MTSSVLTNVLAAGALACVAAGVCLSDPIPHSEQGDFPLTEPGELFPGATYLLVFDMEIHPADPGDEWALHGYTTYVLCADRAEADALLDEFPYLFASLLYAGPVEGADVCVPFGLGIFRRLIPRLMTRCISAGAEG